SRHLVGHRDAPAGKGEHQDVRLVSVLGESLRELPSCVLPVLEPMLLHRNPLPACALAPWPRIPAAPGRRALTRAADPVPRRPRERAPSTATRQPSRCGTGTTQLLRPRHVFAKCPHTCAARKRWCC